MSPRIRLVIAAALFLGWLTWLGYAAVGKSRGPVVSRAQAAAVVGAKDRGAAVVAEVRDGPDARAKVIESLTANGPAPGTEIVVLNLPSAEGFGGAGPYLLLLTRDARSGEFLLVEQQRSPGYDAGGSGKSTLYRWAGDVPAQARKMFPP